ncbi:nuclear nucleic acid-binding protein C1D [Coccinella septempunctata]|uniref:nuclear nucleic acid-binding protein C1D n=1 Tax=Coccinella septempunctata TaxID=41139 RepID=UPI001D065BF1|nr:nuclear nucleic acid-binding protein C1D [Coccinella septempunctata]
MDFEALGDFQNIKERVINFHNSIDKLEKILEVALSESMKKKYENFSPKEKTDFDLLLAMELNTLYWLHLRSTGENPLEHEVMGQLSRVKEFMNKAKEAHERNTIRPKLDVPAARRFIKHGLKNDRDGSN